MPSKKYRTRRFSPDNLCSVGITGGIGSGKSTVCRLLEEQGYPVLSADPLAIEIEETDPVVITRIKALLGSEAYDSKGSLNRSYVAGRIFSSRGLQKSIEAVVHPAVFRELRRRAADLSKAGEPLVVIEAALIFESGMHEALDFVVVVDAEEVIRIARVMDRDGISAAEVRKRMTAQWPMERKIRLADFVIGNNGSREELQQRVQLLTTMIDQFV
ncbi:MAG: dephospho-CoA kinase [Bacteroidota bacterium]